MKSPWVDSSVPSLGQGWVWYFSLRKRIAPLPDTVLPAYGCAQGVGAFARTRWGGSSQSGDCAYGWAQGVGAFARTSWG